MAIDNELLTFDHASNLPTENQPIVRDDNDVLIAANRSRNENGEWEIRSYDVHGEGIRFRGLSRKRADLAAIFAEVFDGDDLSRVRRYESGNPVRDGVPVAVAVDGKPAVAAWLLVRDYDRETIAEMMDVGDRTVREYLSRFRRRGDGIPDGIEPPKVGAIVPEIPSEFDYSRDRQQIVVD